MVKWEGSNSGSPSNHIQHRLIKAEPIPTDVQNTLAEQAYEEERIEAAFSNGEVEAEPVQLFEEISPGIMFKESKL